MSEPLVRAAVEATFPACWFPGPAWLAWLPWAGPLSFGLGGCGRGCGMVCGMGEGLTAGCPCEDASPLGPPTGRGVCRAETTTLGVRLGVCCRGVAPRLYDWRSARSGRVPPLAMRRMELTIFVAAAESGGPADGAAPLCAFDAGAAVAWPLRDFCRCLASLASACKVSSRAGSFGTLKGWWRRVLVPVSASSNRIGVPKTAPHVIIGDAIVAAPKPRAPPKSVLRDD